MTQQRCCVSCEVPRYRHSGTLALPALSISNLERAYPSTPTTG